MFWQKSPINAGVPQNFILGLTLLLFCKDDLPDDAITNFTFYADDTTLNSKYDCASDFVGNKAKGRISKQGNKKTKHAKFSEKGTFFTPCFLVTSVLRFAFLPYYRLVTLIGCIIFFCHHSFMLQGFTLPVIVLV